MVSSTRADAAPATTWAYSDHFARWAVRPASWVPRAAPRICRLAPVKEMMTTELSSEATNAT